jgi:hypothetical protein
MVEQIVTPCEYARERHRDIARWRNLWTILIFSLGSVVVFFLILSIFLFLREAWLPGALSSLGTIINGVCTKWVVDRRSDAVKEEESAYKDVVAQCQDRSPADKLRQRYTLFAGIR